MPSVYSRNPLKSTVLGTVLPFGLENLPIGFAMKIIFFLDKKCSFMERTKPGRRVYNDCVPYGGRVPNHNKKEGMKLQKEQFDITGMTCSACSARIEKSVGKLPGIKEVSVNLLKNSMVASYDESVLDTAGIVQAVEKAGYGAFPKTAANVQNKSSAAGRTQNPETSTAQRLELSQIDQFEKIVEKKVVNVKNSMQIIDNSRKILFLTAPEIHWHANVWYMERFHLSEDRLNPSSPVQRLSFIEVTNQKNRELLQEYAQYHVGIGGLTIANIRSQLYEVKKLLKYFNDEISICQVDENQLDGYFRELEEKDTKDDTFNKRIVCYLKFYQFLNVRGYIKEIPFQPEYYLKKTYPEHHDRTVEEEVYMEILHKLHLFPQVPRLIFLHLRRVLEDVGNLYERQSLSELFLSNDFPSTPRHLFKFYSDAEIKRLNEHIFKMDEQICRALIIHQLLGTRISDTLTLKPDCLSMREGRYFIRIDQVKSVTYEKAISEEVARLIMKAIDYTKERYGETTYIFVKKNDPTKPYQYSMIQNQIMKMIRQEDIRDDNGELLQFGTHIFRHCYGKKLTEMHVDDWMIARLLGHTSTQSVHYYRKIGNKLMADETRAAREKIDMILLDIIEGWDDYEI